jgi:hypothetical protein
MLNVFHSLVCEARTLRTRFRTQVSAFKFLIEALRKEWQVLLASALLVRCRRYQLALENILNGTILGWS